MDYQTLIGRIASQFGHYCSGSANGGSTNMLYDANLVEEDNFWTGQYLTMLSGSNAGSTRLITMYTQNAGIMVAPAFPSSIASGDLYEIKGLRDADIKAAIDGAVLRAGGAWAAIKVDETMSLVVGQQMYALPDDLVDILSIDVYTTEIYDGSGDWTPFSTYELIGAPGSRQLLARGWEEVPNQPETDYRLRITYLARPNTLQSSTDTLGLDPIAEQAMLNFVMEYSLHLLHEQALARANTGEASRMHLQMARDHLTKAMTVLTSYQPVRPNRRVTRPARPRMIG
jgi:hypothetical protein